MLKAASIDIGFLLRRSFFAALIAALLFFHLIGLRTVDSAQGLALQPNWTVFGLAVAAVFILRFAWGFVPSWRTDFSAKPFISTASKPKLYNHILLGLLLLALVLPFTPLASRYVLDVMTLIFTYMILAYGLNAVVGYTGLLDLGFAAVYALGAYTFALLAKYTGLDFWQALPLAMLVAGTAAALIGLTVLRLRGDYFAVVTLGFAEILRVVLLNWVSLTNGPNGITGIPRPSFFGITFEPAQRVIFLYYLGLLFAGLACLLIARLRHLPLGRAWEAVREDELAAQALGINLTRIKLSAYIIAAFCGAVGGAFFATRQGFISPESFTFMESALVLAIVVLGGMGHPLGIVVAAGLLIGLPEVFRELHDYRMIAFGAGLVLIMILKPQGLFARRQPAVRLAPPNET
jgi:branched-chain amino acid transport system permease protein